MRSPVGKIKHSKTGLGAGDPRRFRHIYIMVSVLTVVRLTEALIQHRHGT